MSTPTPTSTLVAELEDLALRVGTEFKTSYGRQGNLASLSTTEKSNLVGAINEVNASVATASGIDDGNTSTSSSWSSQRTANEISTASTADRARSGHTGQQSASTVDETTDRLWFSGAERTKLAGVAQGATANATDAFLLDAANHTGQRPVASLSDFPAAVDQRIETRLGSAPANLDTLTEIAARLGENQDSIGAIMTGLANRVRVDGAQALSAGQQQQARDNIGAVAAEIIGDIANLDAVATFEAALL